MSIAIPKTRLRVTANGLGHGLLAVVKRTARPVAVHLADHAYTLAGFGCVAAAFFLLSVFAGLLALGLLLLVFEWKVSE